MNDEMVVGSCCTNYHQWCPALAGAALVGAAFSGPTDTVVRSSCHLRVRIFADGYSAQRAAAFTPSGDFCSARRTSPRSCSSPSTDTETSAAMASVSHTVIAMRSTISSYTQFTIPSKSRRRISGITKSSRSLGYMVRICLRPAMNRTLLDPSTSYLLFRLIEFAGLFWSIMPLIGWASFGLDAATNTCTIDWRRNTVSYKTFLFVYSTIGFFLPLFITFLCYYRASIVLKSKVRGGLSRSNNDPISDYWQVPSYRSTSTSHFN